MLLCTRIGLQVSEADAQALECIQGKCRDRCNCGLVLDRDSNSAITMLQRFLARLGPHMLPWVARVVMRSRAAINTF